MQTVSSSQMNLDNFLPACKFIQLNVLCPILLTGTPWINSCKIYPNSRAILRRYLKGDLHIGIIYRNPSLFLFLFNYNNRYLTIITILLSINNYYYKQ